MSCTQPQRAVFSAHLKSTRKVSGRTLYMYLAFGSRSPISFFPAAGLIDLNASVVRGSAGLRLQWEHYPRALQNPQFVYSIHKCTAAECVHEFLSNSSTESVEYFLHNNFTAGLNNFTYRNVSVSACAGENLSLCGPPRTFREFFLSFLIFPSRSCCLTYLWPL